MADVSEPDVDVDVDVTVAAVAAAMGADGLLGARLLCSTRSHKA